MPCPPIEMMRRPDRREAAREEAIEAHRREAMALLRSRRREAWAGRRAALARTLGAWWPGWLPGRIPPWGSDLPPGLGRVTTAGRGLAVPIPFTPRRAAPHDAAGSPDAPRRAA